MSTFFKVNSFVEALAERVHNLGSDQLRIALTNTNPTATATRFSDLVSPVPSSVFSGANPFNVSTTSSSQTAGTYRLVVGDLTLTANTTTPQFRFVVLFNDTATNDELIGYYDYGSSVTLNSGETFRIDWSQVDGVLTIV